MATAEVSELRNAPERVRVVTAASLFDGHDAAINIMRRVLLAADSAVHRRRRNWQAGELRSL